VAVLFVAHDLAVVEHISQRVAVMYLGRLAEVGTTEDVFARPQHPYTRALIDAIPHPDPSRKGASAPLAGEIPSPLDPPSGCRFHPRCPLAVDECRSEQPELSQLSPTHQAACLVTAPIHAAPPQR
jgi:oligopeptide/dipeptide ABC transporter ATP-binding protein